ncbi:hypothetical protein B0T18DRAFT_385652 [Schizothecium vesticola]|uniref:Uncharacterized protein n=1 Tax=Schizothecium vesticola TaxID=314040 RepID=A0AA40KC93_9PEZI|nr:hypothetical protein B0T18DRAFT_385652 [Schizothecium vesticola]
MTSPPSPKVDIFSIIPQPYQQRASHTNTPGTQSHNVDPKLSNQPSLHPHRDRISASMPYVRMWNCHMCGVQNSVAINPACTNIDCQHHRDSCCEEEVIKVG